MDESLGTGSYMDYNPQPKPILVRLTEKIAQAKLKQRDLARQADAAGLPKVLADIDAQHQAEVAKMEAVRAEIQRTQQMVNPVPQVPGPPQLGMADMATAGIGALLGGAGSLNQSVPLLLDRNAQRDQAQFQTQSNQYGADEHNRQGNLAYLRDQLSGLVDHINKLDQIGITGRMEDAQATRDFAQRQTLQEDAQAHQADLQNTKLDAGARQKRQDLLKSILSRVAPEQRHVVIGQMGLGLDEDALAALDSLTPKEKLDNSKRIGQDQTNEFNSATMLERINQLYQKGDIQAIEKVGKSLNNDLLTIRKKYLPQELQNRVNKANSTGTAKVSGSKPVAQGTVGNWTKTQAEAQALVEAYTEEYNNYADLLRNATIGNDPKEAERMKRAMNAVKAKIIVAQAKEEGASKALGFVLPARGATPNGGLNGIHDPNLPHGPINGGSTKAVPSKRKGKMSDADIAKKYGL